MAKIKGWMYPVNPDFVGNLVQGDTKARKVVNTCTNDELFRIALGEYFDQSEGAFKSTAAGPILMSIFVQCDHEGGAPERLANELVSAKISGESTICSLLIEGKGSILASALSSNDKLKKIISHFFPEDKNDEHFKKLIALLKKVKPQPPEYTLLLTGVIDGTIDGSEPSVRYYTSLMGGDMDEYYLDCDLSQFVSKTSSQRNTRPLSAQNIGEVIKHIDDITAEKQRKEIQQVILSNPKIVQNIKKVLNEKTDPKLIETVKKAAEALKDPKFKSDFLKKYGITINPKK
ncbi:MAG: hypothetical protein Q4D57_04795 [Clostridia bacterium]|nr:hypothetical protein [Clostridia bacterium]